MVVYITELENAGKSVFIIALITVVLITLKLTRAVGEETDILENDFLSINLSECRDGGDGYVLIKTGPNGAKLKLFISLSEDTVIENQNQNGEWERHNLYFGKGLYTFVLYENIYDNKYKKMSDVQAYVASDCRKSWLEPNDHIVFSDTAKITSIANSICIDAKSQKIIFRQICSFIEKNFAFDYIGFYQTAQIDYEILPDIDNLLDKRMGLCKDLSSATVAMLRSQGVPAVMAYGFGDKIPHAWVIAKINGQYVSYDPTVALTGGKIFNYHLVRFY